MKIIDLTLFAEHSQKLPSSYLEPRTKKETSSWSILAIHFIDFTIAYFITTMITMILAQSMGVIMAVSGLEKAFSFTKAMEFSSKLLPLVVFSYFFFSYFFNHGQTVGMRYLKKRVSLPSQSFRESFYWALRSFLLCATGGLSFLFSVNKWEMVENHDYLYESLLEIKETSPVSLLATIEAFKREEDIQQTSWNEAA